jgi:glutathione peroxidase
MEGLMNKSTVYDFSAKLINGKEVKLEEYKGSILLIVNVASKCGFTPQYAGLEQLYKANKNRGLVILGFPCNQFSSQEPGTNEEIASFCSLTYNVSFPIFEKIDVNGPNAHPLYQYLSDAARGAMGSKPIKWNFTKFLVGKDGVPIRRYASATTPESLAHDIEKMLS